MTGWVDEGLREYMDGSKVGWMDGRTNGWTDGWTDGREGYVGGEKGELRAG